MKLPNVGFSIDEEEAPRTESTAQYIGRGAARTAARVGEALLGLPGDIAQTALSAIKVGESGSHWLANKLGVGGLIGAGESAFPERTPLPTSEDIRTYVTGTIAKALPEKYLEPQSPGEKFSDDFFSDLTSLAIPLPGIGKLPFKRALAASGLGNLASWAAQDIGAPEEGQQALKLGTMLAVSMAGKGRLNQTKKDLYKTAESAVKDNVLLENRLKPIADKWEKAISKGTQEAPSKAFINDRIKDIKDNFSSGNEHIIDIKNALELKKDWNEIRYSKGIPSRAKPAFNDMMNALHDIINEYGSKHKLFYEPWKRAENIHMGLTEASQLNSWLQKHITPTKVGGAAAGLLLGSHLMHTGFGSSIGAIGGALALKHGIKAFEALKNSKEIRKYYANVIKSAAKNNAAAAIKNAQHLNKAIEKNLEKNEPTTGFSISD